MSEQAATVKPGATPALRLQGISKHFGEVRANTGISLTLAQGEILGLLGENGAGKTTLISILFGHYVADSGHIAVFGQPLEPGSQRAAIAAGIGLVHQHFTLAANLTVLDNVLVGTESLWQAASARQAARARLRALSEQFGLRVDPDSPVHRLSVGEQQRVEILKSLYRQARILVLDEPTAVLTPGESITLFETLRKMAAAGLSVILISHKLDEVLRVADQVAVLRAGELVAQRAAHELDRATLAELMVGRRVVRPTRTPLPVGDVVWSLRDVSLGGQGGRSHLHGATLDVHAHEIVGVVGVAGNGQQALLDLACGLRAPQTGTAHLRGKLVDKPRHARLRAAGLARIPEDRHREGVVGDLALWHNAIIEDLGDPRFSRWGWLRKAAAMAYTGQLIEDFDIRCAGPEQKTRLLSGGNMQKLIIGRGLAGLPAFIVASQPVRGLDEGAIADVHARLLAARARGAAVLLVTDDLDEALELADRIVVIQNGRLSAPIAAQDYDVAHIGMLMLGEQEKAHAA
jgi:simple sugar transport system ATP-binding protein